MAIYMKIEGIDGDVTAVGHENWMELMSYTFGLSQPPAVGGGGGGGARRADFSDVAVVKPTGKGSPALMLACCNGTHYPNARLHVLRNSPEPGQNVYIEYTLEDVVVTSYQVNGDSASMPVEAVSLNYRKITYLQRLPGDEEQMYWDRNLNRGG